MTDQLDAESREHLTRVADGDELGGLRSGRTLRCLATVVLALEQRLAELFPEPTPGEQQPDEAIAGVLHRWGWSDLAGRTSVLERAVLALVPLADGRIPEEVLELRRNLEARGALPGRKAEPLVTVAELRGLDDVVAFLLGERELMGRAGVPVWYGDEDVRPRYWWRSILRERWLAVQLMVSALKAQVDAMDNWPEVMAWNAAGVVVRTPNGIARYVPEKVAQQQATALQLYEVSDQHVEQGALVVKAVLDLMQSWERDGFGVFATDLRAALVKAGVNDLPEPLNPEKATAGGGPPEPVPLPPGTDVELPF